MLECSAYASLHRVLNMPNMFYMAQSCLNMPEYALMSLNMSEHGSIFLNVPEYVRKCLNKLL